MTTRRTVLLAATGALATSVVGCGDGAAAATAATPDSAPGTAAAATPAPGPGPAPAPAPAPPPASTTSTAAREAWATRSTAPGVVATFDFSAAPANGGTWKWGSLSASPKVTVEAQNDSDPAVGPNRVIDTTVYPTGSTASLRWDIPSGTGERSDLWRISIDNYADQFGENSEFWVQWRTRMNSTMASFQFANRGGGLTAFKHTLFGEGMERPNVGGVSTTRPYYGYQGPNTQTYNVLADTRSDSDHELAFIHGNATDSSFAAGLGFKYPVYYHSKYFYGTETKGQDSNYYTYHNSGNEAKHVAACQYTIGVGGGYTDKSTCFIYPADQWFTLMFHAIVGPYGTAVSSLSGSSMTGYTNSTIEVWAAYDSGAMQLLHRRTGVVLRTNSVVGPEGPQRYGTFGWTTFMTQKDATQPHPTAQIWVSQIIVKSGPVPPSTPI